MNVVRWDPFKDLMGLVPNAASSSEGTHWQPAVDVFERDDVLVFRAEVPGVDKEDIDVQVEDGVLTLHGSRKRDVELDDRSAYRLERSFGEFVRKFSLPRGLDVTKIKAVHKNGLLEVSLPKAEESRTRKIKVEAA